MDEYKLIVAGGRDFADYPRLSSIVYAMADVELADKAVSIVSGMARGADALGYRFAKEHNVQCYEFPADWDKYGKRAGFVRNAQMGDFADGLLAFWNGSNGTGNMIAYMKTLGKPVTVVNY